MTVVLITCSYRGQEFVRIGYYVNNDFVDQELRENPPDFAEVRSMTGCPRHTHIHTHTHTHTTRVRGSSAVTDHPRPTCALQMATLRGSSTCPTTLPYPTLTHTHGWLRPPPRTPTSRRAWETSFSTSGVPFFTTNPASHGTQSTGMTRRRRLPFLKAKLRHRQLARRGAPPRRKLPGLRPGRSHLLRTLGEQWEMTVQAVL